MHAETGNPAVEVAASPARPVKIFPFRGVRLSPQRIANPAIARAFARPYRDVAQRLLDWQAEGYVEIDTDPAFYLHEYSSHGMTIRGLVCTLDLSTRATGPDERSVFPHEGIHPEQADDLAERMHEMGLNPAPILMVHQGPADVRAAQAEVMARPPAHDFEDRSGQRHRLWVVDDPEHVARIEQGLASSRLMIADGHHRYAAYLRLQERHPGTAWDRGLIMVIDQDDTPFFLGAIHRTLGGTTVEELRDAAVKAGAEVAVLDASTALKALSPHTWLVTDGQEWWRIRTSHLRSTTSAVQDLHELVLPHLPAAPEVHFHHTVEEALQGAGPSSPSVLLPAPEYAHLDEAIRTGGLLPEKATSFQPKPNLGVLMRSVDSELLAPLTR